MQKTGFVFEIIIADDCSTDNTRELLKEYKAKYPDRIKLILQESNVGPARNWLDLIYYPKSKYIAYLEGDDYWIDPYKLQKQVEFLEENSHYSMSFHKVNLLSKGEIKASSFPEPNGDKLMIKDIINKHYIPSCSLIYRREMLKTPLPDWFITCRIGDVPFEILLASKGPAHFHNEVMAIYRKNEKSLTHNREQKLLGRSTYISMYKDVRRTLKGQAWGLLTFKILLTRMGYIKDVMGLNESLK